MKKKLSLIFLALFLFASASALALDDPGTFFDALIRNGPSQEVCAATKGDDNDTKIEIAPVLHRAGGFRILPRILGRRKGHEPDDLSGTAGKYILFRCRQFRGGLYRGSNGQHPAG